jgi:hypothetical protein
MIMIDLAIGNYVGIKKTPPEHVVLVKSNSSKIFENLRER